MRLPIIACLLFFATTSCVSSKQQPEKEKEKKAVVDLDQDGYTYVETITTKDVAPCNLLFKTKTGEVFEIENFSELTKGLETAYWIKFRRLRRMSKCNNAQPVEATDIKIATP